MMDGSIVVLTIILGILSGVVIFLMIWLWDVDDRLKKLEKGDR